VHQLLCIIKTIDMIQLAQTELLAEAFSANTYILIADLPQFVKVGVHQLKSRLQKRVGAYPGALMYVCS